MPFSKRESRRNPLQRLSDQRRSLALAGLAVGAGFSAVVFRRKRRREEVVEFEPTVQFEAPPAPAQPEPADAPPQPINAAPATDGAGAEPVPAPEPAPAPAPVEPATGELSAQEASIISVLAQSGRGEEDRTAIAVATALERDTGDVTDALRKLGAEGVVSAAIHTSGEEIWAVTERGVRRLGAQS